MSDSLQGYPSPWTKGRGPELHEGHDDPDGRSLREYWRVLVQRRWVVGLTIVACAGIGLLQAFLSTPQFEATSTLQIDRQGPDILDFKDVVGIDPSYAAYQDFYQTQYKILQSRTVIRAAIERLDLLNVPQFATRREPAASQLVGRLRRALGSGVAPAPADPLGPAIKFLGQGLSIRPVRDSQLVVISFKDRDPELAASIANAIAAAYLQFTFESRYGTTAVAREFLTKEVTRVQSEIEQLERELRDISQQKEIFAITDSTLDISEQALSDLNRRFIQARSDLAVAQARHDTARQADPRSLPEVLNSPLTNSLKQQYAELERRASQMSERFEKDWPPLAQLREELAQARTRLEIETRSIAEQVRRSAEGSYRRSQLEVANLATQVERQKTEVQRVNRDAVEFASLREAIATKRAVLNDLVTRRSETETSERLADTRTSNVRVVDAAEAPRRPIRPRKSLNLMLGLLAGCGLGIGLAFVLDYFDNTIKNEDDLRQVSGLSVLGYIPYCQTDQRQAGSELDLASHLLPHSSFTEAFKNLRTSMLLAYPDEPPRSIVVSSCEPNEGKSTVAINLAISLTQLGRRVLLVDADLRRPRLHRALGLSEERGLSNLLSGNALVEELIQPTDVPGLDAVASGPVPPNPSELLNSQGFVALLASTRSYDHVVFDSPPTLSVSDALIIATRLDGMIMVVRARDTTREALSYAAARLRQGRVRVIGAVLNAATDQASHYRYYYGQARSSHATGAGTPPVGRVRSLVPFRRSQARRERHRGEV